jgi:hypothetical protein
MTLQHKLPFASGFFLLDLNNAVQDSKYSDKQGRRCSLVKSKNFPHMTFIFINIDEKDSLDIL